LRLLPPPVEFARISACGLGKSDLSGGRTDAPGRVRRWSGAAVGGILLFLPGFIAASLAQACLAGRSAPTRRGHPPRERSSARRRRTGAATTRRALILVGCRRLC